jgi:hypothetical protein
MEGGDSMPPCDGSLVRVHLIPKQLLKREHLPKFDPRTYVYACGGPMGNGGHHGMLDQGRRLRIRFEDLPVKVVEFAEQHNLTWWLEREYVRQAEVSQGDVREDREAHLPGPAGRPVGSREQPASDPRLQVRARPALARNEQADPRGSR